MDKAVRDFAVQLDKEAASTPFGVLISLMYGAMVGISSHRV